MGDGAGCGPPWWSKTASGATAENGNTAKSEKRWKSHRVMRITHAIIFLGCLLEWIKLLSGSKKIVLKEDPNVALPEGT